MNLIVAVQCQARQTDTKSVDQRRHGAIPDGDALLGASNQGRDGRSHTRCKSPCVPNLPTDADLAEDLSVILDEFEIGLDDVLNDGVNATTNAALSSSNADCPAADPRLSEQISDQ